MQRENKVDQTMERDKSRVFIGGVTASELVGCLGRCEGHPSVGVEPVFIGAAPEGELFRACLDFDDDVTLAEKAFVSLGGLAVPGGEAGREKV